MLKEPGFFGSVQREINWWKDKAHELDQENTQLKERIKELEELLNRALVAEGLCTIRWCEEARAALHPTEEEKP